MSLPSPEPWSAEVRAIFQRIVDAMVGAAPTGWQRLELEVIIVGGDSQLDFTLARDGGQPERIKSPGFAVLDPLRELRELLYRPGGGAWYTARCSVTDQGSFDIDLDYDNAPPWQLSGASPSSYAADLATYPRTPENTPGWLADKVAQAGGDQ